MVDGIPRAQSGEIGFMPQGISLLLHLSLEPFLEGQNHLIVAVDVFYAFPQLHQILGDVFGILKLVDHFPIFQPLMVEVLQSDLDIGEVLFGRYYPAVYLVQGLLDLLPVGVALLFVGVDEFCDRSFQILELQLDDTFYAFAVQLHL